MATSLDGVTWTIDMSDSRRKSVTTHRSDTEIHYDVDGDGAGDSVGSVMCTDHSVGSGANRSRSTFPHLSFDCDDGHDTKDPHGADLWSGNYGESAEATWMVYDCGSCAAVDSTANYMLD